LDLAAFLCFFRASQRNWGEDEEVAPKIKLGQIGNLNNKTRRSNSEKG
jgi:hypothetical protein